jgi:glycerophosphoryl diester phosphodiesterase
MKLLFAIFFSLHAKAYVERIAHRGAPHFAPENTLSSFRKAIELQADYLELDIQQTKDHQLVIMHDSTISRTSSGKGSTTDYLLSDLIKLDAGSWYSKDFSYERIPTLKKVFELGSLHPKLKFILEVKQDPKEAPGIEQKLVSEIKMHHMQDRVILKSFSYPALQRLKNLARDIPQIYVFVTVIPFIHFTVDHFIRTHNALDLDVEYVQSHSTFTPGSFIKRAHDRGKKVIIWGVNSEADMDFWIKRGADGIETDRLDLLNQKL